MRLKVSKAAAEERLTTLVNDGYSLLNCIDKDYRTKQGNRIFNPTQDISRYQTAIYGHWLPHVVAELDEIFPTELEANQVKNVSHSPEYEVGQNIEWSATKSQLHAHLSRLTDILASSLPRYTDLPTKVRLYIEDIYSFRKVRDVNPAMVTDLLTPQGYLDIAEERVQLGLEKILDVAFHKRDWGGETNDLYTSNVIVNGGRSAAAFLLKGNGLRAPVMEIKHCGKNGDQLVRLLDSPAELFVVQFVGEISEAVIKDLDSKVSLLRSQGKSAWYCIVNGQDTARMLRAYGTA